VRVAWVSRHPPLRAELDELRRLGYGDVVHISRTFTSAEEVLREVAAAGARAAVVVLPLSMIASLIPLARREKVRLLWAEMEPPPGHRGPADMCPGPDTCELFDGDRDVWLPLSGQPYGRHVRFKRFSEIEDLRLILRPL